MQSNGHLALFSQSKELALIGNRQGDRLATILQHEGIGHRNPWKGGLEARRLFYYTDKSAKEVYTELGFEDAAHFSRFFKKHTNLSPSEFKKSILLKRQKGGIGHSAKPGIPFILSIEPKTAFIE